MRASLTEFNEDPEDARCGGGHQILGYFSKEKASPEVGSQCNPV